jgi:hypothetical protein
MLSMRSCKLNNKVLLVAIKWWGGGGVMWRSEKKRSKILESPSKIPIFVGILGVCCASIFQATIN